MSAAFHVPRALSDVQAAAAKGEASEQDVQKALTAAVARIVKLQSEHGLDVINDGELCKSSWANYVVSA